MDNQEPTNDEKIKILLAKISALKESKGTMLDVENQLSDLLDEMKGVMVKKYMEKVESAKSKAEESHDSVKSPAKSSASRRKSSKKS